MKIERKETDFQPVVITLESQMEVDALADALCIVSFCTSSLKSNKGVEFVGNLAELLNDEFASDSWGTVYYDDSWRDTSETFLAK